MQLTVARAQVALDAPVLQSMPVAARHAFDDRLIHVQAGVNSGAILYPQMWVAGEVEATVEKASQRTKIRPPAAAGLFYAGDRQALRAARSGLARRGRTIRQRAPQGADRAARGLRLFGPRGGRGICDAAGERAIYRARGADRAGALRCGARDRRPDGRCVRNAARLRADRPR